MSQHTDISDEELDARIEKAMRQLERSLNGEK